MSGQAGPRIAYFSMEIAVDPRVPTYAGGLGVLAGDTLRSAADLALPIGQQSERPEVWRREEVLERLEPTVTPRLGATGLRVSQGHKVPVYFLDTNVPGNQEWQRTLTAAMSATGSARKRS